MTQPVISIVIVNYNGRHHLERCLPTLLITEGPSYEIIIVDNASQDDSCQWLAQQYPQVRVLSLTNNLGFGQANWRGVEHAQAPYIAFLNNDTEVTPDWLIPLVALLEQHPHIQAVCSQLVLMKNPTIINALGGGMARLGHSYDRLFGFSRDHPAVHALISRSSFPTLFPTAAAMLMRKADFITLGGFDPTFFMYHEDVDLGWRIWLNGGEVHCCPQSVIYHYFGGTTAVAQPSEFRDLMGMRHNIRTLLKCYQPRRLAHAMFDQMRVWLQNQAYRDMLLILGWNLLHLPSTLRERWAIQRQRTRHDRELFERGLILVAPHPPWGPTIPEPATPPDWATLLQSPVLRLADDTATTRLGAGWYPPEWSDNFPAPPPNPVRCRWTNGLARCTLILPPQAQGQLVLRLRTPGIDAPYTVPWLELTCNKNSEYSQQQRWEFAPHSHWIQLTVPVTAAADGLLQLTLRSSTWAPERALPNHEARLMGCGVYDIRFEQQTPAFIQDSFAPNQLSVIIPTYNRCDVLLRTLRALQAQTVSGFEVIIIDDGSTDDTAAALEQWQQAHDSLPFSFKLIRQTNTKQGVARNRGLREAQGEFVLFLGDDIIPDPEFIAAHLAAHQTYNTSSDVAIIGLTAWDESTVQVTPFLDFINYEGPQFGYRQLTPGAEAPFTCFYTSNISLRRAVLGDAPFDVRFNVYGWEDCELGLRLCRQGLRIIYHPAARAVHSHDMTLASFLRRQTQVGEALQTFVQLQPDILSLSAMGDIRWQVRAGRYGWLLQLISPLLSKLDRIAKRPWSSRIYLLLLGIAFGRGVRRGRRL
ncbi:glycosyltransferase [Thiospirillum jenense]|uniref:Glycosyltransferase n=1 Tax=Thiospirillum jenense TaxID=1653858 RepID=A0A839HCQ1_9GAMM|nr:glycosyltransferase [Thiospirillum jenense]MBB1126703.1 glycosyltransferase [Thiospirillum jenense]